MKRASRTPLPPVHEVGELVLHFELAAKDELGESVRAPSDAISAPPRNFHETLASADSTPYIYHAVLDIRGLCQATLQSLI